MQLVHQQYRGDEQYQQGEYLLVVKRNVVKRNRPELEAEIRQLFALPPDPRYPVQRVRTVDSGHGRLTVRQLSTSSKLNLALAHEWRDVAQVFLLARETGAQQQRWVTRHGGPRMNPSVASPALLQRKPHPPNYWRSSVPIGIVQKG